ncbi:DinB family protein [Paenibacillus aurantius]|uniref:DinB family protein n=1 Tax=Paenibacillus aurantius TaxID=2918900 RepID=A0AA96LBX0_9BACL|nr:DinB family protein [Paenibacillus aurantius]WNQ10791.1 DinB family protein [Paenibacillus aurantius]
MFTKIDEFIKEFEMESAITERVLNTLTDKSLTQMVSDNQRTLGEIAWHLVSSIHFLTYLGLSYDEPLAEEAAPLSAAKIASEYRRIGKAMLRAIGSQWTDESLSQVVNVAGEDWRNGDSLRFTLRHEIHHRGQLTVLMRQAGLRVPPVLGPTREDWIDKGMKPYA